MDSSWIIEVLNEINELLTNASGLSGEYSSLFDSFNNVLLNITGVTGGFTSLIAIIITLIELLIAIVGSSFGFIALVVSAIGSFLTFLFFYLLDAIPHTVIAKKAKSKGKWLAWIPIFQNILCLVLLCRIPGKKSFQFGKLQLTERSTSLLIYLLVHFFGAALVTTLIGILNFIPGLGQILGALTTLLYLLPKAICTIIEFVYLRDVLDLFKANKKSNRIAAWVVSLLDNLVTFGWAKRIYLITIMGKTPLSECAAVEEPEVLWV